VLIDFLCQRLSGELRAGADAADARWFTPEEIEKLPLALDTAQVIQAALAKTAD
jgi:ADP-ribose pyrophosphatase YjhB (NUDIX family)